MSSFDQNQVRRDDLSQVSSEAKAASEVHAALYRAIEAQRDRLAEMVVARQYERQPELWKPYGAVGREKSVRDVCYHLSYFQEALAVSDPSLFADYIAWLKVLFANLNFPDTVIAVTLECMRDVLLAQLPSEAGAALGAETAEVIAQSIHEYIQVGLDRLSHATAVPPSYITSDAPLSDLAEQYLRLLLRGERHKASRIILDAVEAGASVKDIYLDVFQCTQKEVGRLWQMNQVSVAQEHYCTAATQFIMSQLYPYIFSTARVGRCFVATCVGGELHEMGVRMVADFFEMAGWDTYYLGANTPTESILQTIKERDVDVLGISATMTFHVRVVADLIERVRTVELGSQSDLGRDIKILVGGYPFNIAPSLWQQIGADGFAYDAQQAVDLANSLVT